MSDLTDKLERFAKNAMPGYPDDICSEAKSEINRLTKELVLTEAKIEKCAKIIEDRMTWWINSSDQRIRDGSENALLAKQIRALSDEQHGN